METSTTTSSPPPPGWGPTSTTSPLPSEPDSKSPTQCRLQSPLTTTDQLEKPSTSTTPEFGQLICGVCRSLLSYPNGAIHVKCASCRTVNHVLQAHQVGLVKCGSCFVLLMYKFGSPSVKCSCCRFVTEIGVDNKRPLFPVAQDHSSPPHIVQ
ncbi:Lol2 [Thalictrum thalictroides]|uniref:Lol2 n=1 Tax=Thalictrum thalictroides TaxID=46969 RepID=A0A7J6WF77_THATH|nr:Lol2 [Thalictrum thalictroides]